MEDAVGGSPTIEEPDWHAISNGDRKAAAWALAAIGTVGKDAVGKVTVGKVTVGKVTVGKVTVGKDAVGASGILEALPPGYRIRPAAKYHHVPSMLERRAVYPGSLQPKFSVNFRPPRHGQRFSIPHIPSRKKTKHSRGGAEISKVSANLAVGNRNHIFLSQGSFKPVIPHQVSLANPNLREGAPYRCSSTADASRYILSAASPP
jgi:hypothetical protein